jgi:ABC-type protease/lipase transport system fused ATPase/permease subunit
VVVALIIAAFFGIIGFGFYRQRCARKTVGSSSLSTSAAAQVEWSNLRYYLPLKSGASSFLRRRRVQAARPADMEATKSITASSSCSIPPNTLSYGPQILCGLSGSVGAGTMMAILGPSGAGKR